MSRAHYTDTVPTGERRRALALLESAHRPFHAVRAAPRPDLTGLPGVVAWDAYAADAQGIDLHVLETADHAAAEHARETMVARAAPAGGRGHRAMSTNGALLLVVETDEPVSPRTPRSSEIDAWLGAFAGAE